VFIVDLKGKVYEKLKTVIDPELNINVVDLGLIYNVEISEQDDVNITMTLTTPGCPLHDSITSGVRYSVESLEETRNVHVNLVWEPAWSPEKMTPEGLKLLGR
jgi:metal-sulfur cluster biosynthetic enzyme